MYDVETDTGYYTAGGSESASALLKNCRCNFQPITAREWARREAAGAVLELVP